MQGERISWIDVARGIGIILVIYGHGLSGDSYRHLIYSFHMPLFFFLSGVVFHVKKYEHFPTILKKTAKGILLPYFIFALVSYLLWFFTLRTYPIPLEHILKELYGIVYGNGATNALFYNGVLWFLPCLFLTKLGFTFLTKFLTRRRLIFSALFILSVLGFAFSTFLPTTKLPFSAENALTAIVLFGAGYLFSTESERIKLLFRKHALLLLLVFTLICIVTGTLNFELFGRQVDLRLNRLNNYFYFYTAALAGIFATVSVSILLGKQRLLEYLGKHSLILFGWHLMVFGYLTKFLQLFLTPETMNSIRNLYLAPLYTVLAILIIFFCSYFIKKLHLMSLHIRNTALGS